jgi:hypothetical protein
LFLGEEAMSSEAKLPWSTPTVMELIIPEEWRPVIGYEGLYEVSNYGQVRSLARTCCHNGFGNGGLRSVAERILKPASLRNHLAVCSL